MEGIENLGISELASRIQGRCHEGENAIPILVQGVFSALTIQGLDELANFLKMLLQLIRDLSRPAMLLPKADAVDLVNFPQNVERFLIHVREPPSLLDKPLRAVYRHSPS